MSAVRKREATAEQLAARATAMHKVAIAEAALEDANAKWIEESNSPRSGNGFSGLRRREQDKLRSCHAIVERVDIDIANTTGVPVDELAAWPWRRS